MWYVLYNLILVVGSPIILGILLSKKRCRLGLLQRLGAERPDRPDRQDQPLIWVHAVSLGEVTAVTPLVKELFNVSGVMLVSPKLPSFWLNPAPVNAKVAFWLDAPIT